MGTAVTTIQSIDPLTGAPLQPQTFQTNAEAIIGNPITAGGVTESNLFNLLITSAPQAGLPAPGGISLLSAASFPTSTGDFLAQYWEINIVNQNGGLVEFQGILREDFVEGAIGFNAIDIPTSIAPGIPPIPFPSTIAEGTQISGVFSQMGLQATIVGNTNQLDSFIVEVNDTFV